MSTSTFEATLEGIYNRLSTFAPLTAVVGTRVYSHTPEEVEFPFVRFNLTNDADEDSKTTTRNEYSLIVQGFSREPSPLEASQLVDIILDALDRQETSVTITGASVIRLIRESSDTLQESDLKVWQGRTEFDLLVE